MVAKYTILSVLIRPEIQEKVSVGLLFFDADRVFFGYSKHKLLAAKSLLSQPSFKILKDTLENIEKKIEGVGADYIGISSFRALINKKVEDIFYSSNISYLSRYSNNVVAFTGPKEISLEINSENFKSLFKQYIDNIVDISEPKKVKPFDVIKNQYGSNESFP